jgi:hypothetical protein
VALRGALDLRSHPHLTPMELSLDMSDSVAAIAKSGAADSAVTVTLVAADHKGNRIEKPGVSFESISLSSPE